jgi:hypothetical protein
MMKSTTVFSMLLVVGMVFSSHATGADPEQNCGRLKTGDNFNRINEILDCIESKINVYPRTKLENTTVYDEEKEPNDSIGNANFISLGSTIKAQIKDENEYDIFTFIAPDSQKNLRLILRQTHLKGFSPRVIVYDHNENIILGENGKKHVTVSLQLKPKPKEQYYISVTCGSDCNGDMFYELQVREEY